MRFLNRRMSMAIAAIWLVLICVGFVLPGGAQTFYGSLVGTVTDSSGAVVPGAQVVATNIGTNEKHDMTTDSSGLYRFVDLVPADYKLDIEAKGFKHFVQMPISVAVGTATRIDVGLQVGAATETVSVTAATPLLETESGEVGETVEGERVQQMPLNGRNTMNLLTLTPGVIAGAPNGASALNAGTHTNQSQWSDYSIGGGLAGGNVMYVDGVTLNMLGGNSIAFIPTQDAVQEFRVMSSGVSPEYGRFSGGVVNMATKTGSNAWHGSVYEYFRNNVLNANNFFNIRTGQPRPQWNQNQFGATLGNPIVKDKLFSFFSWEGFHLIFGVPGTTWVPTTGMLQGKFYHPFAAKTPYAIVDPLAKQLNRTGCVTTGTDSGGQYYQISSSCYDPTAQAMLNLHYWPTANTDNVVYPITPNWVTTPATGNTANQYAERVDYHLSDKQRLFARYTYWGQVDVPYNQLENFTENSFSHNRSTQAVVGDTYSLNSTMVLDARLGYDRLFTDNQPYTLGKDLSVLGGAWPTLQTQLNPKYLPGPHINSTNELGGAIYPLNGMQPYSHATLNDYDLSLSLTKLIGHHSLKFGGELRLSDYNGVPNTLNGGGNFAFTDQTWLSGDSWADFLFGVPYTATVTKLNPSSSFNWYQGYYAYDVWQAGRKLTVNFGARWELPGSIGEKKNRIAVLLPTATDPTTGVYGTEALVNTSLYPSRWISPVRLDLFAPRLGFAYRITDSDVIRGGYGITYLPPDLAGSLLATSAQVNAANTSWTNLASGASINAGTPYAGQFILLNNPFPNTVYPNGINNPLGRSALTTWTQQLLKTGITGPVPNQPYPFQQQWDLNVGHQFQHDTLVEIGYIGASSSNLPTSVNVDQLASQYWTTALATSANTPYGTNYTSVTESNAGVGIANYDAGTIKLEKRFTSGGVISANYTYAKSLADVEAGGGSGGNNQSATPNTGSGIGYGAQNSGNLRNGEYSLASFDVRDRFVASYVLPLPFGQGKRFAHFNGVAGAAVSGWTFNGITTVQNGFPLSIAQSTKGLTLASFGYAPRPNRVAGCEAALSGSGKKRLNQWFNTTCFTPVGNFALGNEPRVDPQVRADGVANWDMSLLKATKIRENLNVQFRTEFFNTFNHPQFAAPDNSVSDGSFGQVTNQANNPRLIQFSLRVDF